MSIWALLGVVVAAGALGGAINALMTDNGFRLPKWDEVGGARIWRPGWIANVVVGLSAAAVSWGLYGPYANDVLVGTQSSTTPQNFILTLSSVVGAFLAGTDADANAAAAIATATPAAALQIADDLPEAAG
jgi:hypothetical protein